MNNSLLFYFKKTLPLISVRYSIWFFCSKYLIFLFLSFVFSTGFAQLTATVASKEPTCFSYTNGEATAVVGNGTLPYKYLWSNGQQDGQTCLGLGAGNYSVTITDYNQQTVVKNFTVTEPTAVMSTVALNGTLCAATGYTAIATGGYPLQGGYTYTWTSQATNQVFTGQSIIGPDPGGYYLYVADTRGCHDAKYVKLPGVLTVEMRTVNVVCGGNCDGSAEALVKGGVMPYTYKWSYHDTTSQSISHVPGGNYSVTVTDASGCTKTVTGFVYEPAPLAVNLTLTGQCSGSATATAIPSGGNVPYKYSWSNGATTNQVTGLVQGQYFVTVTDANGCNKSAQVLVSNAASLTFIPSKTDAACNGINDGTASVRVTAAGSMGPYSYKWSNNAVTTSISNLSPGNYTITITDGAGCTQTSTLNVGALTKIIPALAATAAACTGNTGSASVTGVAGGTAPYTYVWSNASKNAVNTGLAAGTYSVVVTDNKGCRSDTSSVNVLSAGATVTVVTTVKNAGCNQPNGSASATASGGTAPYTFSWSNGTSGSSITNVLPGNYSVTATDANGCKSGALSVTVGSDATALTLTPVVTAAACGQNNGSVVLNVTGGSAPYTYIWAGTTPASLTTLAPGNYSVVVTDASGCKSSAVNFTVNAVSSNIVSKGTVVNATCGKNNGAIALVVTGGNPPYTYSTGSTTNGTGYFANLSPGIYTFTIADAGGCSATTSAYTVASTGSIKAKFTTIQSTCFGDSSAISFVDQSTGALNGIVYSWSFSNGMTSSSIDPKIYFKTITASAQLVVQSQQGCRDSVSLTFPVDVLKYNLLPTATACQSTDVKLSITNLNPASTLVYNWQPITVITAGNTTATPTFNSSEIGTKKVYVRITNVAGCSRLDSVLVTVVNPAANPALIKYRQDCQTRQIFLSYSNAPAGSYCFQFGDPANPTAQSCDSSASYTYPKGGNYGIKLVANTVACMSTLPLLINVRDTPTVTLKANTIAPVCSNDPVKVTATSNISALQWSLSKDFTTIAATGKAVLLATGIGSTVYYVRAVDAASGCKLTDSVIVTNKSLNIQHDLTVGNCNGGTRVLVVKNQSADSLTSINWSPASLIDGSTTVLSPTIKAGANGTLIGTFSNGVCNRADTLQVASHSIKAGASASALVLYKDETVTLLATPPTAGFTYKWSSPADLTNPTATTTFAKPTQDTRYAVTVTDNFGCSDTASVFIRVLVPQCAEPYVFIPRAFTPNGDGINDKFFVRGDYLTQLEFVIYNRWGEQVFKTLDKAVGWDGTYNGQQVTPDVYGYYVKGTCQNGETYFKKGNVTVMK